jgi:hypothetical protein
MLKGIIVMAKLENTYLRTIGKNNTAKTITIPRDWGKVGERVCIVVEDEDTLIVSKKMVN